MWIHHSTKEVKPLRRARGHWRNENAYLQVLCFLFGSTQSTRMWCGRKMWRRQGSGSNPFRFESTQLWPLSALHTPLNYFRFSWAFFSFQNGGHPSHTDCRGFKWGWLWSRSSLCGPFLSLLGLHNIWSSPQAWSMFIFVFLEDNLEGECRLVLHTTVPFQKVASYIWLGTNC